MNGKRPASLPRRTRLGAALAAALACAGTAACAGAVQANAPVARGHARALVVSRVSGSLSAAAAPMTPGDLPHQVLAPVLSVTNCNDHGEGSLRDRIEDDATSGAYVDLGDLQCSVISLTTGAIEVAQDSLHITNDSDPVTINHPSGYNDRLLHHTGSGTLSIAGSITLADGKYLSSTSYPAGGCIYSAGNVKLTDVTISSCKVQTAAATLASGGAVFAKGSVTLLSSTLSDNGIEASGGPAAGGAVCADYIRALDSWIVGNTIVASGPARGGGLAARFGVDLEGTAVNYNQVTSGQYDAAGGAVFSPRWIRVGDSGFGFGSVVAFNTAHAANGDAYGGGVAAALRYALRPAELLIEHSWVVANTASADCWNCDAIGGGISVKGALTLDSSLVADNVALALGSDAEVMGGGVWRDDYFFHDEFDRVQVINSMLTFNRAQATGGSAATATGGGLYVSNDTAGDAASPLLIRNSTIAFNEAGSDAGGLKVQQITYNGQAQTPLLVSSIIASNAAPVAPDVGANAPLTLVGDHNLVVAPGGLVSVPAGTLVADPQLVSLNPDSSMYRGIVLPLVSSPAVDAGSNPGPYPLIEDQRGEARVVAGGVDIGATERQGILDGDFIFRGYFEYPD